MLGSRGGVGLEEREGEGGPSLPWFLLIGPAYPAAEGWMGTLQQSRVGHEGDFSKYRQRSGTVPCLSTISQWFMILSILRIDSLSFLSTFLLFETDDVLISI